MFLAEITDGDDDTSGDTLAKERPPAKHFYKHLQDKVIEYKVEDK